MAYAVRVRLYCAGQLEADTDPDAPEGTPGSEVVATLADTQRALVELCQAAHGPDIRLLGFGDDAMRAYYSMLSDRVEKAHGGPVSYHQHYTALLNTPALQQADMWMAQVDIAVSR